MPPDSRGDEQGGGAIYRTAADPFGEFTPERPRGSVVGTLTRLLVVMTAIGVASMLAISCYCKPAAALATLLLPVGLLGLLSADLVWWVVTRRLWRAARSSIQDAQPGRVAIVGRIQPSHHGCLVSPVTGRSVVWASVETRLADLSGDDEVACEMAARDFWVSDGSGQLAYVVVSGAHVVGLGIGLRTIDEPDTELRAALARRLRERERAQVAALEPCRVRERALEPGAEVVVVGRARRERSDGGESDGRLVLQCGGGAADELLVAAWPPPGRYIFAACLGAIVVGALVPAVGLLMQVCQ
jgi:hypothetical protein